MSELLNTRCTQGTLIITETHIVVRLRDFQSRIRERAAFTGIDCKRIVPSIFGLGGGWNLIFHGKGGERLHANMVKPIMAKKAKMLLTGIES